VMGEYICYEQLETKDLRKESLNFIINKIDKDYISQIEIPPPNEMKKMDNHETGNEQSTRALVSNRFYPAYRIHKAFSKIKESSRYSSSEMLNLLKFSLSLQELKESLYTYKEQNRTSDLEILDVAYSFGFWNVTIIDIGECASK